MSDLERLKSLLLAPERESLQQLGARIEAVEAIQANLPRDLPALLERAQQLSPPGRLGRAIVEPVADALGEAVSRRRQSIVDALFPVIMPAIRRAIAEYLRTLSSDINRLLESSLTPRGIGWRIQSWRSGVPYAEMALKHSLRYRVDYLLLIQRETGLVLDRERATDLPELDGDAVAGMLTAIGDFVRDSVADDSESLSSATVGEHLLWVLEGPHAKLAAFIRGVPPSSLKLELQARLEALHLRFGDQLALDPAQLIGLPEIRDALTPDDLRSSEGSNGATVERPPSIRLLWIAAVLLLIVLATWAVASWRWQQRLDAAHARLSDWPGLHLVSMRSRLWRSVEIDVLIDPMARSPLPWLREQVFSGQSVNLNSRGYLATDAEIASRRLRAVLQAPESIAIDVSGAQARLSGSASLDWQANLHVENAVLAGIVLLDVSAVRTDIEQSLRDLIGIPVGLTLSQSSSTWTLTGTVDASWRARLSELMARHPELADLDVSGLVASEWRTAADINAGLLDIPIRFSTGTQLIDGDAMRIDRHAELLQRAATLAHSLGSRLVVEVYGLSDTPGTQEQNSVVRQRRAEFLVERLKGSIAPPVDYEIHVEATALVATIRTRAVVAQLRFE